VEPQGGGPARRDGGDLPQELELPDPLAGSGGDRLQRTEAGRAPDPAHLVRLVEEARRAGARLCLVESYYPRNTAQRVVDLAKLKLLPLASDTDGKLSSYTALIDAPIAAMTG
jgi:hypothetical protein